MGNLPVDRDSKFMYKMWGTTNLITDYWNGPQKTEDPEEKAIQEIMHDDLGSNKTYLQE